MDINRIGEEIFFDENKNKFSIYGEKLNDQNKKWAYITLEQTDVYENDIVIDIELDIAREVAVHILNLCNILEKKAKDKKEAKLVSNQGRRQQEAKQKMNNID